MISVCMTTYNGERYLREQLVSILDQLGKGDELIISDDSSTDTTLEIIRDLGDARIRLLTGNSFYSPIYNIENAIKKASGELLVLADQDDIWLENKLAVVREKLGHKIERAALVMMDGYIIDGDGMRTGQTIFRRQPPKKGVLANLYDNCFTGCTLAFTRPLLELALPFPAGIPMHDAWLGILALLRGEVEFAPEKTIEYRRHGTNLSYRRRNPLRQIRWRLCLSYHLWHRCKQLKSSPV